MIIYLFGPDSYRREKKTRDVLAQYHARHAQADFFEADFGDGPAALAAFSTFLEQPSLFVPVKFALARGGGGMSESNGFSVAEIKRWVGILKKLATEKSVFLAIVDAAKPLAAFRFLLNKPVRSQEFAPLSGSRLSAFIDTEAAASGAVLGPDGRRYLFEYGVFVGDDAAWAIRRTLEKLALFGGDRPADACLVREVVGWSAHNASYPLALGFLQSREPRSRLSILERIRARGDDARYTLNLLCSIAQRPDDVLALARADELVKSGALDDETALAELAVNP